MMNVKLLLMCLVLAGTACQATSQSGRENQETATPEPDVAITNDPDSSLADVFRPWDGHWRGTFSIYLDPNGQQPGEAQPRVTRPQIIEELDLELSSQIAVEQFYESTGPFYQTVRIVDTYGDGQQVESSGYNAVRGDSMICVVNKPDEQVLHLGEVPADQTIIWQRSLQDPTKVEYFYEWVEGDTYSILGWGYYGQDDPQLTPRMWFYATYRRVVEE